MCPSNTMFPTVAPSEPLNLGIITTQVRYALHIIWLEYSL